MKARTLALAAVASLVASVVFVGLMLFSDAQSRAPADHLVTKKNAAGVLKYRAPARRGGIHLTLTRQGDDIVVLDDDRVVRRLPQASASAIDISGPDHIDTALTIDYAQGSLAVPIDYHPGALGSKTDNELILQGGTNADIVHTPSGAHSGIINVNDIPIRYSNLTPITDTSPTANYTFSSNCPIVNIADSAVLGQTTISTGNCSEAVSISNKMNVTVALGSTSATVTESIVNPATGLTQLNINGNVAKNAFNITPVAGVPINVQGFVASPATDALTVNVTGATNVAVTDSTGAHGISGTYTFGNRANVVFEDMLTISPSILTVSESGAGSGQVTSSPAGINCSASSNQCAALFAETQVTLTASAAVGSTFAGWSGGGCSGTGTCVITPTANTTITATFNPPATLTVAEIGSGTGQVTSSPPGITCSASSNQCAAPFALGTQVSLTASASAGSSFAGWSGGGCGSTGTCVVTLSANTTVTATFTVIPSFMLSVSPAGTGVGTVASSPSGIACGATCSASFQSGTQVTLSATPAIGSTFAGWSGAGCSGTGTCSVTISAATAVAATFVEDTTGNLTLVAAVLPLSRSVQVGNTATAFATMINAGPADASTCTIAPTTAIPASFVFQTTDPTTNALIGTANTPANIAAGQPQSFVIALTPTAAFAPTNVTFTFNCANAPSPAAAAIGVDTLNLSGSTTPVPDVVALAASADPGFVDIPGATGTGVFAVATVNLGIDATITAGANTGTANLPVILTICQTDPASGACLAAPAPSATTDIQPNATPTFGIFVTGSAAVANLPGVNRVFVTLTDAGGVLRGETSVAVRTQ
jgi:hypothetical protein